MEKEMYQQLVDELSPRSPIGKNCLWAFFVGGGICTLGQVLLNCFGKLGMDKTEAGAWCSICLIFLSALFTGLSLYDDLAKHAGAGTLVPITGFANAITAPATEFRTEGFVMGVGAKLFSIAGPVIVYGLAASMVYGLIYWAIGLMG